MASGHHVETEEEIAGTPLLVKALRGVGFERIHRAVSRGSDRDLLVQYALVVVFLETVVLQGINVGTGRSVVFFENPLWLINPFILLMAAFATHSLLRRYESAIVRSNLLERSNSPDKLKGLVPPALSATVMGVGVVFTIVNAVFLLTIPQIHAAGGYTRLFKFLVITPFGYVPILGTFFSTYIAVEVLLPRRLETAGVNVDFLDPEQLGGMRPVGELLKYAYYFVMIGLTSSAISIYGPYVLGGIFSYEELTPPGTFVNAMFTAVWVVAVGFMAHGIYVLHRFMIREKRQERDRLNRKVREQLDEPWDIQQFDADNPPGEYQKYRAQLDYVTSTKEYPATFTMWTQLLVGVLVPKAIQLVLNGF
jgi:hypothetical protein